jgi:hypothetical protein
MDSSIKLITPCPVQGSTIIPAKIKNKTGRNLIT